jgi:hypothetical protein
MMSKKVQLKMRTKQYFMLFLLSAMMLMSAMAFVPVSAGNSADVARATWVCYFVNPTTGETLSGDVLVDFYGTYRGSTLYSVQFAVYKDGAALTSFVSGTNVGGNHWQITWDTTGFDDGNGYVLYAKAYRKSTVYIYKTCDNLVLANGGTPPPPVDTEAPSVTITAPANGATVSGTVSVAVSATDNVGVESVQIYIDDVLKATGTTYSWDTTGYSNGNHAVKAIAYDAAGNSNQDINTVTVDNGVTPPPSDVLTSGTTVYSSLSATGATEMWRIWVEAGTAAMRSVLNCGSADFDLYGRAGAEPTTSTYDWRGYTSGGEDVTFSMPAEGWWYIMVRSYSGTGPYDLTVTLQEPVTTEWGNGGKYAIIVGISNYWSISDLSYCDEDATDWYNQLNALGWECHVYGDDTSPYPVKHGQATEAVVRSAIIDLAAHAQPGDQVAFITSGHGSGDGRGSSFLCMLDCSGSVGCYYDTEMAADFGQFSSGVEIFIFVDHCYSGGLIPEIAALSISSYIYMTTTCTEDGYGWDDASHYNGMWTYYFLDYSWQSHYGNNPGQSMESVFTYAHDNYPKSGGDEPQQFDGNPGAIFTLN